MSSRNPQHTNGTTLPTAPSLVESARTTPSPGLVLTWKPKGLVTDDRVPLEGAVVVGRSSSCSWCIRDQQLSRSHFSLEPAGARFLLRDRGSRNGLFLNGSRLDRALEIEAGAVIRAGGCLFVVVTDLGEVTPPGSNEDLHFAGKFTADALLHRLRVAARTGRHVLIEGESGTGKELAAEFIHRVYTELDRVGDLRAHNAALFAGEDDAIGGLFGVTRGAFTGVTPRTGQLELAHGGTLFLDEAHALPLRVQQSLLRFAEDGVIIPLGHTGPQDVKKVDVRLVLGTNVEVEKACDEGLLAHDLIARLRRITIPPLRDRRADIPSIFERLLQNALDATNRQKVSEALSARVVERLCLHDYCRGNVRELVDIISVLVARLEEGEEHAEALRLALDEVLDDVESEGDVGIDDSTASVYDRHREEIIDLYDELGGNLSKVQEMLTVRGISSSRRWLSIYLERWGVRMIKKRK